MNIPIISSLNLNYLHDPGIYSDLKEGKSINDSIHFAKYSPFCEALLFKSIKRLSTQRFIVMGDFMVDV